MIWRHDSHGHDVYAAKPARVRTVVCRNLRVAIYFLDVEMTLATHKELAVLGTTPMPFLV